MPLAVRSPRRLLCDSKVKMGKPKRATLRMRPIAAN
jgi:hypothetical protein